MDIAYVVAFGAGVVVGIIFTVMTLAVIDHVWEDPNARDEKDR